MATFLPSQRYHFPKTSHGEKEEDDHNYLQTLTSQLCGIYEGQENKEDEHQGSVFPPSEQCHLSETNIENEDEDEDYRKTIENYEEIVKTLPKGKGWMTDHLVHYKGFWLTPFGALKGLMLIREHFKAKPGDIFLTTFPKSGTTWLKALIFATVNRTRYDFSTHPLLKNCPHDCFPFLDAYINENQPISNLDTLPSPRLFATHIPYPLLPTSMIYSGSCFVYICRNPKDVLVSKWVFMNKLRPKELPPLSLEEAFELFCEGISHYGPYWEHVLGFWKASLEYPDKILFLRYEEMKKEPLVYLKRLAEFFGQPFSPEEESEGVIHEIIRLCSFENLSSLEVNKTKVKRFNNQLVIENRDFFRKGKVGDWQNHLTSEMIERLDQITEEKLHGTGLTFNLSEHY
ncbi:Sulfotransferase [Melia azedarach]|uniref:Sulfotransferase n=1 Tax=Melia azedarach TaxID=155640 RepID=A0ACC1XQU6_MELAZ|nr:Sulfotransferase [Melia azedarach]